MNRFFQIRSLSAPFGFSLLTLALLTSLAGCQLFWTAPGTTIADSTLQRDVRRMVGVFEAADGGSDPANVVDTRYVSRDENGWVEIWVVDRGGTRIEYTVNFRASPMGGTDIAIKFPGTRRM